MCPTTSTPTPLKPPCVLPDLARPRRRAAWPLARRTAVALAACALGATAHAQADAEYLPQLPCDALAQQDASPEQLLPHLQRCQRSSTYLAHLGHQLNRQQRYPEAAEHLERAILFDPDATAAQMDYAIALAGSGDTLSALQLMAALLQRPGLPPEQRAALMAARARWAQAAHTPLRQTRLQAGLRWGWDNNLLGAPNLSSLTLTFPSEVIQLPLDESNRPRPGTYLRTDARLDHTHLQPSGTRWDLGLALLHRRSPAVPEAGSHQAEAVLERSHPGAPQGTLWARTGHYLGASGAWLHTGSGTSYRSLGTAAGLQWQPQAASAARTCQSRLGLETQQRNLHSNPLLSGRYWGLAAQWHCASLPQAPQWRVHLRTGQDRPLQPGRPGGAQHETALRATWSLPHSPSATWLLDAELTHTRDATGYSPLLANNTPRRQSRAALRLEYQHTWPGGLQALAGLEAVAQHSNLPLFGLRSQGVYLGLRASW